ncbi:2-aminoethylphosphonate ABC transporter permease subunit [Streptomyces albus]|uniref:2-aminoethylphosphonate ABC transporter permease subunit n=1 Tax=Streptomyces albus TaxID=1888 RepID=UPI003700EB39
MTETRPAAAASPRTALASTGPAAPAASASVSGTAERPGAGAAPPRTRGAGPSRRAGGSRLRLLWCLPPLLVLTVLFLYPLALVVVEGFRGGTGTYREVFASQAFTDALVTTVALAVGATVGCVVLGFVLALVVAFVPFPGSRGVARFVDVFLSFPSFLITLALLFVYGTVGMANGLWTGVTGAEEGPFRFLTTPWGVLLAEITYFTPFVMRPLLAAFAQVETGQIEAASSLGARPARIVRRVILPEAWPALMAGGSLVLVLCLNEFAIVLFTGAKDVVTLPMLVYSKAILSSDYTAACCVATVNVVLSVGLYALYRYVTGRAGRTGGTGRSSRRAGALA